MEDYTHKTYKNMSTRLFLIGVIFTIIFILVSTLLVDSVLNNSIELTYNVHYNQRLSKEINLLKILQQKYLMMKL